MKQQPLIGFLLSSVAVLMWGTIPIILQPVLTKMNVETVVWYRFTIAAIGVLFILSYTKKLPHISTFNRRHMGLFGLAIIGLSANFVLYNLTLKYIPASTSQILSPLSSFFMLICGVFIFKETIQRHQKWGIAIFLIGLPLFFNKNLSEFTYVNEHSIGIFFNVSSSLVWVAYSVSQKFLLKDFSSQQILFIIYAGCAMIFTPIADISQITQLSTPMIFCLLYACIATVAAFGCYAEALNHWEVSKVSMVLPTIPLVTIAFSYLLAFMSPNYFAMPNLNMMSFYGAGIVVLGAFVAIAGNKLNVLRRRKDVRLNI